MSLEKTDIMIDDFSSAYRNEVVSLLDELQAHIVALDPYQIQSFGEKYQSEYFSYVEQAVAQAGGKMLVALLHDTVVGFVAGVIEPCDEIDVLSTICPRKGRILELVISESCRGQGIGKILMQKIEGHLIEAGCEYLYVDVFATNVAAAEFYSAQGYSSRNIELIKKVK